MELDDGETYEESEDEREFKARYADDSFFLRSLEDDVERCEELLVTSPDDQFARRTLVRTTFAEIEGLCASILDWSRYYASGSSVVRHQYTEAERLLLGGVAARLNSAGVASLETDRYLPTRAAVRFALSLIGRDVGLTPSVDYGVRGWEALVSGFVVRDRLMHPKKADDLEVSDQDMQHVRSGRAWFSTIYRELQGAKQRVIWQQVRARLAK